MDDLLVGDAIEDGNGLLEDALSGGLVAGFDGLAHALDRGAQARTLTGVVGALFVSLTGTLAGLCAIGHIMNSEKKLKKKIIGHDIKFEQARN